MKSYLKNLLLKSFTSFFIGAMFIGGIVFAAVSIPGTCTTPGNCNDLQTTLSSLILKTSIKLTDSDASNYVGLQSPTTVTSNIVWKLPAADGTANQILATDGAGNLIWKANSNAKRIGEFVFKKSNYYANDTAAIADGYLPVKPGTIVNGKNLYPLWATKNTEFISGNDIVFPSNVNGIFLRNTGGNATTEGTFQSDATAANGLGGTTSSNGDHSHGTYASDDGGRNDGTTAQAGNSYLQGGFNTANAGNHSHTLNITSTDVETRPDNRAYQLYTIIDTY